MKRYRLTVAYDGTNYCGWQVQPTFVTVEEKLNQALTRVMGQEIAVIGASRTDSGVHALGNVAVFDAETSIPGERIRYAVNSYLPEDIRIVASEEVAADFHPRYCDTKKTYEYHILNGPIQDPTARLYSWWVPRPLDVPAMREAGEYLVGKHDFKSFCAAGAQVKSTVRRVLRLSIAERAAKFSGREIVVCVTGEGFLYNMVRIITGTLVQVGIHRISPEEIPAILAKCDRKAAGETAPPQGLFLKEIEYL